MPDAKSTPSYTYIMEDQDEEGEDRTGNYCVKMKLDRDIPQLLPMWGRRVKIFY